MQRARLAAWAAIHLLGAVIGSRTPILNFVGSTLTAMDGLSKRVA